MRTKHLLALSVIALCLCSTTPVLGQGSAFTYQGRLSDGSGLATGTYDLSLAVYAGFSGGSAVAGPVTNSAVLVSNGLFTVTLDLGTAAFPGADRWLEIGVRTNGSMGAFQILAPRQQITSTPYAILAANAGNLGGQPASSYAPSSGSSAYVAKAGDTMTGVLALPQNGLVAGGNQLILTNGKVGIGTTSPGLMLEVSRANPGGVQSVAHFRSLTSNAGEGGAITIGTQNSTEYFAKIATVNEASNPSFLNPALTFWTMHGTFAAGSELERMRITSDGLVGIGRTNPATALDVNGTVTATNFAGSGSGLTALTASNISGTLSVTQLPSAVVTNGASGVNISGTFSGNGAGVTNLNLSINSGGAIALGGSFVTASTPTLLGQPYDLTAVDVNGDGKVDLVTVNPSSASLFVMTNDGKGGFTLASSPVVGTQYYSIASADFNGDNKADLVVGSQISATLVVLTNDGSGGFVVSSSPSATAAVTGVVATDVNGDGKPDLIAANYGLSTLTVLTNNGSGGFIFSASIPLAVGPYAVAAADVNGDSKMDLITANWGGSVGNTLTVLTNNGSGGFVVASSPTVGTGPYAVTAADVNGDGKIDLISANIAANSLTVLTNIGGGLFVTASSPSVGAGPTAVVAADLNGDGRPDLVAANYGSAAGNTLTVLINNGGGTFILGSSPVVAQGPHGVVAADVNGDGKLDVVSANYPVSSLTVLLNTASFNGAFIGTGSGLTNLNASSITTGTLPVAQLPVSVVQNGQVGVTLNGTFAGNGANLTNVSGSTAANYVSSYDTNGMAATGTFQDVTFSTDNVINGWKHTGGTAFYTNTQTGLYLVQYCGQAQANPNSSSVSIRALINSSPLPGSQASASTTITGGSGSPTPTLGASISKSFIASLNAGDTLRLQLAGSGGGAQLIGPVSSPTNSISMTVIRIQ